MVNPDGGNMKSLAMAVSGACRAVIAEPVLSEFVRKATADGLGRRRRVYDPQDVDAFLRALDPILRSAVRVGVRDVRSQMRQAGGHERIRDVFARAAERWRPIPPTALLEPVKDIDDAPVMLAAIENDVDILVTSNLAHFAVLQTICSVEAPSTFLGRFDL